METERIRQADFRKLHKDIACGFERSFGNKNEVYIIFCAVISFYYTK